ncbi:MAG: hypothetical protein J1E39_09465 [Eubacterium sp.]|nr:hypothetical protein [Eubacterium sp.]
MKNNKKLCCIGALALAAALFSACASTPVILNNTAKPYGPVQFDVSVTNQSYETASDTPSAVDPNGGSQTGDNSTTDGDSNQNGNNGTDNNNSNNVNGTDGNNGNGDNNNGSDDNRNGNSDNNNGNGGNNNGSGDSHNGNGSDNNSNVDGNNGNGSDNNGNGGSTGDTSSDNDDANKPHTTSQPETAAPPQTTPAPATKPQTTPAPATKPQTTPAPATKPQTTTTKPASTTKPSNSTSKYSFSSAQPMEQEVFNLVNEYRAKNGVKALTWDPNAYHAALIRAKELVPNWGGHTRPDGSHFYSIYDELNVNNLKSMGENLAGGFSTAKETFNQWINSDGHRANILADKFTGIGIAMVYSPGSTYNYYWVQEFTAYFN